MGISNIFQANRPLNFGGASDRYLPLIAVALDRLLAREISSFTFDTMKLIETERQELAVIIVEFAEDIHCDIGFWKGYETFNEKCFGMPFPPVAYPSPKEAKNKFIDARVNHLLQISYEVLKPDLLISSTHRDLRGLSSTVSQLLVQEFRGKRKDSGVQQFLAQPNLEAGDVKRKLIWVGTKGYLFRHRFENYLRENGRKSSIPVIDDFICQENTKLSGLGVIDILSETLAITNSQRDDLRRWYERHIAYYQIRKINGSFLEALNIINGEEYTINAGDFVEFFKADEVFLGSLIPWDGVWYWSGKQHRIGTIPDKEIGELKENFLTKHPRICYRYHKELLEKAKASNDEQHSAFVEYFGNNLVFFADGLSMASAIQKKDQHLYRSKLSGEELANLMERHKLKKANPDYAYPEQLLESNDGIGYFFNPQEGQEIMQGFDEIVSGFKKNGIDLTEEESGAIRSFIESEVISPAFVNRIIKDHGHESIAAAFLAKNNSSKECVEYLLRKYKGHFYRNRYPPISFVY